MAAPQIAQTATTAYGQLIASLAQTIPQPIAKELVSQAWRTICRAREWSFLRAEGYLVAPAAIQGDVEFTRANNVAVADADLRALIETPTLAPLVGVGKMAIRDAQDSIYQIRAYDNANGNITLDKPYLGTDGTRSITIFRQYYTPPITEVSDRGENVESGNFRNWLSISDTAANYRWLDFRQTADWLDRIDSTRRRTGEPSHLVQAPYDVLGKQIAGTGTPLFELWPHYVGDTDKIYHCIFRRDYILLDDDLGVQINVLPIAIPISYLTAQARLAAYEWAEANKGDYPKLQKTNWLQLIMVANAKVQDEFIEASRADEARYPENQDEGFRRDGPWGLYNSQTTGPYPYPFNGFY